MTDKGEEKPSRKSGGWVHFCIAAAVLGLSAVGFEYISYVKDWAREKQSVPWPKGVIVDPDAFRWENLPDTVGRSSTQQGQPRYVLAGDGELRRNKDGLPDGDTILPDDVLDALGIGTSWDKNRVAQRKSNWYLIRTYRDNDKPVGDPLRYWNLDVYYYTGALDTVPHIPERCMIAGGATLEKSVDVPISVPAARSPWDENLEIRRATFEVTDEITMMTSQYVQYYLFSLNGRPEASWEKVRLGLSYPWIRYCYFAKIQFYPRMPVTDLAEADKAAEALMDNFLPIILQALPTPEDIKALGSSAKGVEFNAGSPDDSGTKNGKTEKTE